MLSLEERREHRQWRATPLRDLCAGRDRSDFR